jgi:hypothetical protein
MAGAIIGSGHSRDACRPPPPRAILNGACDCLLRAAAVEYRTAAQRQAGLPVGDAGFQRWVSPDGLHEQAEEEEHADQDGSDTEHDQIRTGVLRSPASRSGS